MVPGSIEIMKYELFSKSAQKFSERMNFITMWITGIFGFTINQIRKKWPSKQFE